MKLNLFVRCLFLLSAALAPFGAAAQSPAPQPAGAQPASPQSVTAPSGDFSFASVQEQAKQLAAKPYVKPATIAASLRDIGYEQYKLIQFRRDKALWQDSKGLFRVEFFPAAFIYDTPVSLFVVADNKAQPITGAADMFDFSGTKLNTPPPNLALAGFRIHYPLNGLHLDEIVAFLGASYFRPIGREQVYGASARGLAIDTGLPQPEEFPAFRAFWLVTPAPEAREVMVWALLDSPAATGAFAFTIRPSTRTVIEVAATIYMRHDVSLLGMAPLTSMFLAGKSGPHRDDYRPEVHDSDGLYVATGKGERIWRPLANPPTLTITSFADNNPRGFGLMQRERHFTPYQDTNSSFERRPSLWVEPIGDWGEGEVRLIEIPTDAEKNDNIAAFWAPRWPPKRGEQRDYHYRISALADDAVLSSTGRVVATRVTSVVPDKPKQRRFVIEFAGGDLTVLRAEQPVDADVALSSGKLINKRVEAVPGERSWRVFIDIEPDGKKPVDLRAFLTLRGEPLTETWTYLLKP
jgi:periplasmic glucans biosynthesis protein